MDSVARRSRSLSDAAGPKDVSPIDRRLIVRRRSRRDNSAQFMYTRLKTHLVGSRSKCEILAGSRCFPLFSQHRTFGATARQGMLKPQRFTLTFPACVVVSAISLADPSPNASNSPSSSYTRDPPLSHP